MRQDNQDRADTTVAFTTSVSAPCRAGGAEEIMMATTNRTTRPIPGHPLDGRVPERIDDRAQPGDVLGIEEEGEVTHLGDTREDEDERREDAEEAVRDNPPSRR